MLAVPHPMPMAALLSEANEPWYLLFHSQEYSSSFIFYLSFELSLQDSVYTKYPME